MLFLSIFKLISTSQVQRQVLGFLGYPSSMGLSKHFQITPIYGYEFFPNDFHSSYAVLLEACVTPTFCLYIIIITLFFSKFSPLHLLLLTSFKLATVSPVTVPTISLTGWYLIVWLESCVFLLHPFRMNVACSNVMSLAVIRRLCYVPHHQQEISRNIILYDIS